MFTSGYTVLLLLGGFVALYHLIFPRKEKYAPGPTQRFLVGNTFQVPTIKTWIYFDKLFRKHGPMVRLSLAGDEFLVLSDPADAEELLVRRSKNYSSRPPLVYAGKYLSNNKRVALLPYGDQLRKLRTAFHQMLQPRVIGGYESIQELESLVLLSNLLTKPQGFMRHCQRFAASLVFKLSYGRRLSDDDGNLNVLNEIMESFVQDVNPGSHLVDTFTFLDYLPDFLATWRADARRKHERDLKLYSRFVLEVKEKMEKQDVELECFAARLWDKQAKMNLDLEDISYAAGIAFEAGTDTTECTLKWFLMAMLMFPEVARKAQIEINSVVGTDGETIPGFSHIDSLPYCVALTKEVLRWSPAAPGGGIPHYSEVDDEYKGFKIKAKTIVISNTWTMHHNEAEFPNPYRFEPERYMRNGEFTEHDSMTVGHYGFGWGRRICPGQHLASKSIWIAAVRLLWAFDFLPEVDETGKPIPADLEDCTSGGTSHPRSIPVRIVPRSEAHAATITAEIEREGL